MRQRDSEKERFTAKDAKDTRWQQRRFWARSAHQIPLQRGATELMAFRGESRLRVLGASSAPSALKRFFFLLSRCLAVSLCKNLIGARRAETRIQGVGRAVRAARAVGF